MLGDCLTMMPEKTWLLTGVLDGPPEFARDRVYLSLRVEKISDLNASGRVWLLLPFRALDLRYGARIQVAATLDRTGNYRNPGVSTLSEYLDRRDFDATGIVRSPASIVRLDDARVFPPLAWLYDWRERLQRAIDSRFSPETAGVLDAALLGNRYNLSRDASERFREGGTFHVLVISGLHISFIGAVVFLVARRLTKRRLIQFLLPAIVVWAYSFAVGAEASVVRAALMFTFAGVATIIFRQASSLNALGGAALVLLIRSPKEIFDPSFQLTFLSVLAIVVIAWPLLLNFSAIGAWHPTRSTPYPPACSRGLKSLCEVLFWSERKWRQELDRSSHSCRLFKTQIGRMAGAISLAALPAIHVWSRRGFCKRATAVVAADDRLFPPAIVSFAVAEHRCQCVARGACRCCNAGAADLTSQRDDIGAVIQTLKCNRLGDGPQRRSVFGSRPRLDSTAGVFRPSGADLCTLLSSFALTD